jgi:hypothetical protein
MRYKKTIQKAFTLLLISVIVIVFAIGCSKDLQIKHDYDFNVTCLPVPASLEKNEAAEMRIEILRDSGRYDSTTYYVRYFQYEGKGSLRFDNGETLFPNDSYRLDRNIFRMYFLPNPTYASHQIELTFYDSYRHEHPLTFNFNVIAPDTATN